MNPNRSIFIVSNRLPVSTSIDVHGDVQLHRSAGGLVTALRPVHAAPGSFWMGYAGSPDTPQNVREALEGERLVPVFLRKGLYNAFYNGAANDGIWPLCHYFLTLADFSGREWRAYRKVNRIFCDELLKRVQPDDLVWVHDYHLMLLPGLLREAEPRLRIGYFHHIPFPASEVMRAHPARMTLLRGLLGADLVGFHTMEYARHFISAAYRLLGYESTGDEITYGDRVVKVGAFPLGIDVEGFNAALRSEKHASELDRFLESFKDKIVILGVDRLDYTKGIPERLKAMGLFLSENPDLREKVVFVQICVPSRVDISKYGNLRVQVERLVGQVNGEFGTLTHVPVHYLFQSVEVDTLTAFYRRADICLTTPLRDGLNLVCKEYVACHPDGNGVLILSEFAGAAEEMSEALIVNPYDIGGTANAIALAVRMTPDEKRRRMLPLYRRITDFNNQEWARIFIDVLNETVQHRHASQSRVLDREEFGRLREQIGAAPSTLICVDFDALSHSARQSGKPEELMARLVGDLKIASNWKQGQLVLMTGQTTDWCDASFPNLPAWIVAEFGAFLRPPQAPQEWEPLLSSGEETSATYNEANNIIRSSARRVPRSRVEIRRTSTVWDLSGARSNFASSLARELAHTLDTLLAHEPFFCRLSREGLVLRSANVNLGTALERLIERFELSDESMLVTIGDNRTDERLFQVQPQRNVSVNIGSRSRTARLNVRDAERLASFIQMVARTSERKGAERTAPRRREADQPLQP